MNAITDFDFEKLQALVDDWVIRYNHIAEISFFQVDDKKQPFGIEFVLCDPPRIAPKWRDPLTIKDGFIKYGPDFLKQEIIKSVYPPIPPVKVEHPGGHLFDYKGQAQKQKIYADSWVVVIRWETDPSSLENMVLKNKKIVYSAPTVDSIEGIFRKFTAEDYEHYGRLSYFTKDECLDLLIGFLLSEKNIHNPRVRLSKDAQNKKGEARKWAKNWSTNFDKTKEVLDRAIKSCELDLCDRENRSMVDSGSFLKWAKEKRYHIPIDNPVATDDMKIEDQKHALPISKNNSASTGPEKAEIDPEEKISRVLIKGWQSEHPIERLSKQRELAIWNSWIKPIVNLHYNGVFRYKYFKEPENLNHDDLGALWEQYLAPVIYSNIPPWLKYPQSMHQSELKSRISENIWEPNLFISDVLIPLKAGRGSAFVDPFLQCLTNIIDQGDLPALLAYLDQERDLSFEITEPTEEGKEITIHTPPGTTWDQIRIRYVNDDHVEIAHPGVETHTPYSMADLGFSKKRELRDIFEMFATFRGDIKPKDMKPFRANISNLRKHLKELFPGIEGKPIKDHNPKDGYCCKFKITKS